MSFKSVMTQKFTVIHLIVKIRKYISKPKGFIVESLYIRQPCTTATGSNYRISSSPRLLIPFLKFLSSQPKRNRNERNYGN